MGIDLRDEGLHAPEQEALWRESVWLDAYDHEQGIGMVVYAHARPASGAGDIFAVVAGPGIERAEHDIHALAYTEPHAGSSLTVGGLRYECTVPGTGFTLALNSTELDIDLAFDANGPIYDYDWESWTNSRHYEQFGLVEGTIRTAAGERPFRGTATRDHAWGARGKVPWRRWVWMTARFEDAKGWGVCLVDSSEPRLLGYVADDPSLELSYARLDLQLDNDAKVSVADVVVQTELREHRAQIKPIMNIDRAGSDPTKKGAYDYYFVEVEDDRYGRGYGILDVFATPDFDPSNAGPIEAGVLTVHS